MATAEDKHLYRVIFHNQGQVYEVHATEIFQSELWGFVEVEGYVFNRSQVVVDPSEERLRTEFEGVERSFIPLHSIIRIDEVEKQGVSRIKEVKGDKIMPFPTMPTAPRRSDS